MKALTATGRVGRDHVVTMTIKGGKLITQWTPAPPERIGKIQLQHYNRIRAKLRAVLMASWPRTVNG